MAEDNRNTENFALGLIVAAIIYFLFRRQLDRALGISGRGGNGDGGATRTPSNGGGGGHGGGCGCGCSGASQALPTNPGVSIGNQSYNTEVGAFHESSLAAAAHPNFFQVTYGS